MITFRTFIRATLTWTGYPAAMVALGFLASLTGCQRPQTPQPASPQPLEARRIDIDSMLLDKTGMQQLWVIPKLGPETVTIKQIDYNNGRLFAVSSSNQLYILDGQTGHLISSVKLGSDASYCSRATFYRDSVLYLTGNQIVELRQRNGERLVTIPLSFAASTNAVRTPNGYFAGGNDGRLYCMDSTDKISKWNSMQPQPPIGTIEATDLKLDIADPNAPAKPFSLTSEKDKPHDLVFFACKDNTVYATWADQRYQVWSAAAAGPIAGVVLSESMCLAPSADTALRCYDANTGALLWKYLSGGKLFEIPCVTSRYVYQRIEQKSLVCLQKKPLTKFGKRVWELDNGRALLAENGQHSFIATNNFELVCMDNSTGKQILSFYVPQADLFVANTQDTTLFLANHAGSIVALRPRE